MPFAGNEAAMESSLLLHDVIRDRMIPFAANALQWKKSLENPQNCRFLLEFCHPAGGPSHGHRQQAQKNR